MIRGVLFDMDGVLTDSEHLISKASIMMFREHGINAISDDFKPFVGTGENRYIGGVAEKYGLTTDIQILKKRTYEIYCEIVKGSLKPLPGALEMIEMCRNRGLLTALATSTDFIKMNANLIEIGLTTDSFNTVVNGQDVENKKPAPDIYLKASEKLGLLPSECLVVEDAVSGIKAAKAAKCKCLAVTTSFPYQELTEADWICNSLLEVPEESINW